MRLTGEGRRVATSLSDPREGARKKVWPAQRTPKGNYGLIEKCYRARVDGVQEADPPEVKQDFDLYQERRKERQNREIPLSNAEIRRWERLHDEERFQELWEERIRKVESWLVAHPELVQEILKPDSFRKSFWLKKKHGKGKSEIEYSPLLGLYSVTAYVIVRLVGIRNESLFLKLQEFILKVYQKKFKDKSISHALVSGVNETRGKALKEIQERREGGSNIPYHLAEIISNLAQIPKQISVAIETYLYKCVENALRGDWNENSKYVIADVEVWEETWKKPPQSAAVMIGEAIGTLLVEKIFPDPIDRIIAANQIRSNSEIAQIIRERLGKTITKQAVQKRRAKRIVPLMKAILEIKQIRNEDEQRTGRQDPISEEPEDGLLQWGLAMAEEMTGKMAFGR